MSNFQIDKEKVPGKALNTTTPVGPQERGQTSSPLNKSGVNKNLKNFQTLLAQLDPTSTKNSKTYLQVSKILNPKKSEYLKQYLKSTLNNSKKPSQKTLGILQRSKKC